MRNDYKCMVTTFEIGSFGYSLSEIQYKWTENQIEVDEFALADYILMNYVVSSRNIGSKNGEQSVISVKFLFSRTLGYYFTIYTYHLRSLLCAPGSPSVWSRPSTVVK